MDLVEFSEARFNEIREDYLTFAEQLPGALISALCRCRRWKAIMSPARARICRGTVARRCWKSSKPWRSSGWSRASRCASGAVC
ncbi:hypothetical protein J4730_19505 [Klebsiella pneumoniae]|uniref:Uncharacterized protein n=1 Tax=Klebsiella pneumoniae TaxID=573 RepID=A0A939NQM5_KLEPN|nr:hypothetical protein [Klebsiella pneumoniae]